MTLPVESAEPRPSLGGARLRPAVTAVERVCRVIATVSMIVLTFVTAIDVVLRTASGRGIPGAIEITEVVLVATVFLGMMTASTDGMHISASIVTDRFPRPVARWARIAGGVVSIGIAGWLLYGAALRAVSSIRGGEYRFGLISVPVWPARVAIVLGIAGLMFALVLHIVDVILARDAPRLRAEEAVL